MTTDTDALLATVREALKIAGVRAAMWTGWDKAAAALDSLAAELRTMQGTLEIAADQVNETEAELERVKAERDDNATCREWGL